MSTTYSATGRDRRSHRHGASPAFPRDIGVRFRNGANARGYEPTLSDLSDRDLMDIGTTRGEIDYVASNRFIDPRGIRSKGFATPRCSLW